MAIAATPRPAAFLDRDGVINMDRGYAFRPAELEFTRTAIEAIRLLNESGYQVIVVSNQSGVARGYFGIGDVEHFHDHMQAELGRAGARIDAFYFCPYHPDGSIPEFSCDHPDRKPAPGMILRAIEDHDVVREKSFMIGDKPSDVAAAEVAGIAAYLAPTDTCDLAAMVRDRLGILA